MDSQPDSNAFTLISMENAVFQVCVQAPSTFQNNVSSFSQVSPRNEDLSVWSQTPAPAVVPLLPRPFLRDGTLGATLAVIFGLSP